MKFKEYLLEKRKYNVMVVDIQPMYRSFIGFDINKFCDFLLEQNEILYLFNGPDTVDGDKKSEIIDWLCEDYYNADPLYEKLTGDVFFHDKGYAFFRGWMDQGADPGFIKKAIRFMLSKKAHDSRDIDEELWMKEFPNDWEDYMNGDNIYLPDIPLNKLRKFSGGYIVGGGKNECLKEFQILMSVFNIRAKEVKEFIY